MRAGRLLLGAGGGAWVLTAQLRRCEWVHAETAFATHPCEVGAVEDLEHEAEALLELSLPRNGDLTDLVEFALFTGLRRGEVLDLTWERVDRARGVIMLDVTKSGKRREVPLNSRADAVLARRGSKRSGLVFSTRKWDHFRSAWKRAVDRAELVDFHFHDLRHTFASWAVQRGASLQEVKDLLGHHSLATLRYGHLAPEHLRSAVARLDTTLPASDSAQASAQEGLVQEALLSK